MHDPIHNHYLNHSRRYFFSRGAKGLGGMALGSLLAQNASAIEQKPDYPGSAKRAIYLFQSGGPAQMDLYDYKPTLNKLHGQEVPESVKPVGQ